MIKNGILILIAVIYSASLFAQPRTLLSGKVVSTDKSVIDFATVYLKGTQYGCTTNEQGIYHLHAPAGKYTLIISAVGFETYEKAIEIVPNERNKQTVVLKPSVTELDEVVVTSTGVNRVKKSAFNAVAVDTKELHNSTKSLSEALSQLPGMKLRESGGVGSDMQLMLDGFSGKHVKVFIDGVPQEGAGTAFDLNNIPVNFAERIEVYKGVVPVGFGTDALGGVINIVTNKKRRNWFFDASYSYGSFNTHKSYVNFGQTFKNGLMYEINAFQNYSDNDYYIREFGISFVQKSVSWFDFSTCTGSASGLFSKKEYAVSAAQMFMMKLCMERCLECTMFALFLSRSLIHSMMYLLRSMILSHMDMSLFFMLALNPCTRCMPLSKRSSKSVCLMYPLSAKTFP